MTDDPYDDPGWKAFAADAQAHLLPMLKDSVVTAMNYDGHAGDPSIQGALELGLTLLLGKPLIVVAPTNDEIPDGLRRAAALIVIGDASDPAHKVIMQQKIFEFMERIGDG